MFSQIHHFNTYVKRKKKTFGITQTRALVEGEIGNVDADSLHAYFLIRGSVVRGVVSPSPPVPASTVEVAGTECLLAGYCQHGSE